MKQFTNKGQFKKGQTSWLKGTKGLISNPLKGKTMPEEWKLNLRKPKKTKRVVSQETRNKISIASKKRTGVLNGRWKGGQFVEKSRARKIMIEKNGGSHTQGEWEILKVQYNFTCPCCKIAEPNIKLTEDHIIPLSKGGSHNIENIQPLCVSCNSSKYTKIIKYEIYG